MSGSKKGILDVAEEIYRTGGAEALSMRKIAEARGVTATALYRHFESKDELLDAVAERGFEQLTAAFRRASKSGTPLQRLRATLDALRSFALRKPALFDLMFFTERASTRRFPEDFESGSSTSVNVLVAILESLGAQDPLGTGLVLWSMAQGLISFHRAGRFGSDRAFKVAWDRAFDLVLGRRLFTRR